MAKQNLETLITINARAGNGFSKLGNTLTEMGSIVNGFSQQLISFGRDSVNVYRSYERSMKDAEVALSTTYGRNTAELARTMKELDVAATDWAATTIFHTNDVADAISVAAHAGWDLEEIMAGLPAAMQLAQAGGLDLSESVNYIVKATSAAGVGFEDLTNFTDQWTFAANSSASDIREYGDAMLRMGSTMRFAGSTEELMTLIAVTANAGAVGEEAGTQIRNSILRLIAPTDKAERAMAQLGAASQETVDLMGDADLAASNLILTQHGFSAYDEQGNLKNILEIYRELYLALGEIAGGFDNIERNQDAIRILSSIFPTRTITEAITLLRGASEGYDGLFAAMQNGAAEGYGAYAAETMMDSLDGKIEIFESKVERLEQVIGQELRDDVIGAADWAGGLIDSLAEMDPAGLSALVSGLEVVAGAGPALLAAGGAFRLIGAVFSGPVGLAATTLVTIGAGLAALSDWNESRLEKSFGTMEMDMAAIDSYIQSIDTGLRSAYTATNQFRAAVNDALEGYMQASGSLSSGLMSKMLTKAELTSADKRELERLADQMYSTLTDAISNSAAASESYWTVLMGGEGDAYDAIIAMTNNASAEALVEAEGLSRDLRNALNSAFADGEISPEEYQQIQAYMSSMNDAMSRAAAQAKSEQDYVELRVLLHKAQSASLDEMEEILAEAAEKRDALLQEQEDTFYSEYYKLELHGADADVLQEAENRFRAQQIQNRADYDELILNTVDAAMKQSDLGFGYTQMLQFGKEYRLGYLDREHAISYLNNYVSGFGDGPYAGKYGIGFQLDNEMKEILESLGVGWEWMDEVIEGRFGEGQEQFMQTIEDYRKNGYTEMADRLTDLYLGYNLLHGANYLGAYSAADAEKIEKRFGIYETTYDPFHEQGEGSQFGRTGDYLSRGGKIPVNDDAYLIGGWGYLNNEIPEGSSFQINSTVEVPVTADTTELDQTLQNYEAPPVIAKIYGMTGMNMYASGGRATEPSIFGDAGAEWAIPEEHSERTAALLNAARAASGWSWPDLLARFGGMNANASHTPTTIVYSPTIHAQDAAGVEEALRRDKKRMEKWLEEMKARDAAEVYT